MLASAIILKARTEKLDDAVQPYLWSDTELLGHLNLAINEWCRETKCLNDETSFSIPVLAGQLIYPMDPRIVQIHNGWLESQWPHVDVKDKIWLDRNCYNWRTMPGDWRFMSPDYETAKLAIVRFPDPLLGEYTGAFTFTASSKAIAQAGTNFSVCLAADDQVVISGTTLNGTTAIPATFTVVTATLDSFTVAETVDDETASAGIIRKVVDTLGISASRLPLADVTLTTAPEIRADYHAYLVDGICREAYMKQDSQCFDKQKSEEHRGLFEDSKTRAINEINRLRSGPTVLVPNRGRL